MDEKDLHVAAIVLKEVSESSEFQELVEVLGRVRQQSILDGFAQAAMRVNADWFREVPAQRKEDPAHVTEQLRDEHDDKVAADCYRIARAMMRARAADQAANPEPPIALPGLCADPDRV